MSDTDISLYPNKTIEKILGKPRELSPEEIAEIQANAENATERFRKRMAKPNNKFIKKTTIDEKKHENKFPYRVGTALSDALEHRNLETSGISQKFKVENDVKEAAREAEGR